MSDISCAINQIEQIIHAAACGVIHRTNPNIRWKFLGGHPELMLLHKEVKHSCCLFQSATQETKNTCLKHYRGHPLKQYKSLIKSAKLTTIRNFVQEPLGDSVQKYANKLKFHTVTWTQAATLLVDGLFPSDIPDDTTQLIIPVSWSE